MNQKNLKNLYGIGDYNTNQIKALAKLVENEEQSPKTIYDQRPDAAPDPGKHIKSIDFDKVQYVIPDSFAGKIGTELINNLDIKQLEKIGEEGDCYLKQAIKIALETASKEQLAPQNKENISRLNKYVTHSPAWQI